MEKVVKKENADIQKKIINTLDKDNSRDSNNTLFHRAEEFLDDNYDIRFNTISLEFECRNKYSVEWRGCNENNFFTELNKNKIKISMSSLLSILKSDFVEKYNPIKGYFEGLPNWSEDDTDYIEAYVSFINAKDNNQFQYHFKKWLVRVVKCALEEDYFNKQAFVLVQREQNSGKSTFCRNLCPQPLKKYFAEDVSNEKDSRILLAKSILINLDELATLNRRELNSLKSMFSKTQINERLPYDRKNSLLTRISSFIGSTNEDSFLNDDTGTVRWLCFEINNIDFSYSKIDINMVWAQAYVLSKSTTFDPELTKEDIIENEKRNSKFRQLPIEFDLVDKHVNKGHDFLSATDVLTKIQSHYRNTKLNATNVGKALSKKLKKTQVKSKYGYYVSFEF